MTLPTALAQSCDTYFYQLGNRFYELPASTRPPLQDWARGSASARRPGSTSAPEAAGLLPTPEWREGVP